MGLEAALIGGGATILGSVLGAEGQEDAANIQAGAANQATGLRRDIFNWQKEAAQGGITAGNAALNRLMGLLNDGSITSKFAGKDVMNEPGYQFGLQEGQRAINNSASARGGVGTAALRQGARYAQDYAGTKYQDAFNRFQVERQNMLNPLFQMAGLGANANQQVGQAGMNYANQAGADMIGAGNALGAAAAGQGNIYGNMVANLGAQAGRYLGNPLGNFRWNDPYSNPMYFGGGEGE